MFKVLILTDSRGHSLGRQLLHIDLDLCNIDLHIMPYSGAKIAGVAEQGVKDCAHYSYDRVYLMAGVNNLTLRHCGHVKPKYMDWCALVRDTVEELYKARITLAPLAGEIIICEIVGLSFWNYNYGDVCFAFHVEQDVLNAAIMRINEYVKFMNLERGSKTPMIADIVHKVRGPDKIEHRYSATLHDGLHFSNYTAEKVLDRLILNILC